MLWDLAYIFQIRKAGCERHGKANSCTFCGSDVWSWQESPKIRLGKIEIIFLGTLICSQSGCDTKIVDLASVPKTESLLIIP